MLFSMVVIYGKQETKEILSMQRPLARNWLIDQTNRLLAVTDHLLVTVTHSSYY